MTVALTGCSASLPRPESSSPATDKDDRETVTKPDLYVLVGDVVTKRPLDSKANVWLPGTKMRLVVSLSNSGKPLVDYPSAVLELSDDTFTIEEPEKILYGLDAGDTIELAWTVASDPKAELGAALEVTVQAYAHNSDRAAGRSPVGFSTFEVKVGQSLVK